MEVRAILAFVLSMLVFAGWNYFLETQREEEALRNPPRIEERVARGPATSQPTKTQESLIAPIPKIPTPSSAPAFQPEQQAVKATSAFAEQLDKTAKDITVKLPGHDVVFSTAGAGIKSFLLFKYTNQDGNPLELIQTPEGNIPSPQITLEDRNFTMFVGRSIYEASTDSLVLSETKPDATLTFTLKDPSGLEVVKEFTFHYDSYLIDCTVQMRYGNQPLKMVRFTWNDGVYSGKAEKDFYTYEGPTTLVGEERAEDGDELEDKESVRHGGDLKWTAHQNKYFAIAMVPKRSHAAAVIDRGRTEFPSVSLEYGLESYPFKEEFSFFLGPKETEQLVRLNKNSLERLVDYGWFGNNVDFLIKPLFHFLQYFYSMTGNYGWSIIILTMIIKVLFFPLSHKSFKSMKQMQKIQPEVKILQERYKNDRQMMSQEMMRIYKENKVNPLGGCLPMVLQIPVFIALYHVLLVSIELRNAPFALWIMDLSEKDPYYVTPILMGGSMFLQQKMTPSVGDPTQQKIMMLLPIVFTFLFLNFPSGLVIYWLINNILTIAQQFYIHKFTS